MSRRISGFVVETGGELFGCEGEGLTRGVFRELIEVIGLACCSAILTSWAWGLTKGRLICRILGLRGGGL